MKWVGLKQVSKPISKKTIKQRSNDAVSRLIIETREHDDEDE